MKKAFYTIAVLVLPCLMALNCEKNNDNTEEPKQEQESGGEEEELQALKSSVPVTGNWLYEFDGEGKGKPALTIHVENPNTQAVTAETETWFTTDMKVAVETVNKQVEVPAKGSVDIPVTTTQDLDPGFYYANCYVNRKKARGFYFGISPTKIESEPDMQDDYVAFWNEALSQLPALNKSNIRMIEVTAKSNSNSKAWFVEFPSVPDGLTGDPVLIRGYYLEPQDGKEHPVIMHFQGYDSQPSNLSCPNGNGGNYAEFYLSHRGQYINNRKASQRDDGVQEDFTNIYGDWFAYSFGNKDSYYYRGAFMDCVQAVHFMATRSTSDMDNLFAEGSSQGGALCYAAAALSDYPFNAIAPNVAFLGDFPDYFQIVSWPGNVAKAHQGTMSDDEMYAFLSYFDTKNLATLITCPVYATSGLQDGTCPPHTNFAPFNVLTNPKKEMHVYPEMTHDYPRTWFTDIAKFFEANMQK